MAMAQDGHQKIGCKVKSCEYNAQGSDCSLKHIEVMPSSGGGTGNPDDESMCGSYAVRS